jgi:quinol monooxygenase YgiN
MAKVQVIARFVAREGRESQLRALLQGMLTPTRAASGCESYELYESELGDSRTITKIYA